MRPRRVGVLYTVAHDGWEDGAPHRYQLRNRKFTQRRHAEALADKYTRYGAKNARVMFAVVGDWREVGDAWEGAKS